ncbi:lre1p [Saccharomyces arboricola H-6]|uniref:Lre1p n=1 Tax=Saccharomyces arboricola (strain H-6 / AS 2.3317 / CBS 10644) TaxID=1160507 RepID=J8LR17_SACAR|nr:lre1p [Saccharomyces arboricola H-6]
MPDTHTQHVQISEPSPMNTLSTPSKRGHRHRRSLAISGDFDFLNQPAAIMNLPPPQLSEKCPATAPTSIANTLSPTGYNTFACKTNENAGTLDLPEPRFCALSPRDNLQTPSPRFFISEEPSFSSPVKGVPDAIINLDDALKTRPRSFKSHRRSESAPPDLEFMIGKGNCAADSNSMIKEEEDSLTESESKHDSNKQELPTALLSPLRPSLCTSEQAIEIDDSTLNGSPTHHNHGMQNFNARNSNKFNSMKIKGQKQRYHHYTKQLPLTSGSDTQSPREQKVATSIAINQTMTPSSLGYTPSKLASTPATPLSFYDNNADINLENDNYTTVLNDPPRYTKDSFSKKCGSSQLNRVLDTDNKSQDFGGEARRRRSGSPISQMQHRNLIDNMKGRRNSNTINSIFNYKSKHYEMPYDDMMKNDSNNPQSALLPCTNNRDYAGENILKENYALFQHSSVKSCTPDGKEGINAFKSSDYSEYSESEGHTKLHSQLTKDILLGEPGDMVDLSSLLTSPRKPSNETDDLAFKLSQDDMYDINNTSKTTRANNSITTSNESWCISDNASGKKGQDNEVRRKRKSKLGLFRHIFSRK